VTGLPGVKEYRSEPPFEKLSHLTSESLLVRNAIPGSSRFTPYQIWQQAISAARQQQELADDIVRLFGCRICLDMPSIDSICLEPCKHGFCRECIKAHIDTSLDGRKFPIACPVCVTAPVSNDPGSM
jgi:hypothetical protein